MDDSFEISTQCKLLMLTKQKWRVVCVQHKFVCVCVSVNFVMKNKN